MASLYNNTQLDDSSANKADTEGSYRFALVSLTSLFLCGALLPA